MTEQNLTYEIISQENNFEWDRIEVEDLYNLLDRVEQFYQSIGNPKMNAFWLADLFLKRLKNDLDYYVNCEGQKGFGKSNLMLLLGLLQSRYSGIWVNEITGKKVKVLPRLKPLPPPWKHIECGFKFSRNMSFLDNTIDIKKKYNSLEKYQPFIIDEGSKNLHKHRWQDKLQFELVKMSDISRYQNKSFFICFPHFTELNAAFRNDRIMMRLYVYHRDVSGHYASAIMSLKDVNRYVSDPWHTDENARKFEDVLGRKATSLRTHIDVLKAEQKLKGYAGNFLFPELRIIAPKIWKIYEKYKFENSNNDIEQEDEKENAKILKWKVASNSLVEWVKEKHPEMTYGEIAKIMNITITSLSQIRNIKQPEKIVFRQ